MEDRLNSQPADCFASNFEILVSFRATFVSNYLKLQTSRKSLFSFAFHVRTADHELSRKSISSALFGFLFKNSHVCFRANHSTETALLRVFNDILRSMDQQKVTILVLLDLSAAFDTVDHNILLHRLHNRFGISGTALDWFKDYLSNRRQRVSVNGSSSGLLQLNSL